MEDATFERRDIVQVGTLGRGEIIGIWKLRSDEGATYSIRLKGNLGYTTALAEHLTRVAK